MHEIDLPASPEPDPELPASLTFASEAEIDVSFDIGKTIPNQSPTLELTPSGDRFVGSLATEPTTSNGAKPSNKRALMNAQTGIDSDADEEENPGILAKKKTKRKTRFAKDVDLPSSSTQSKARQRKAPLKKPASARQIARCYDECDEKDKMLLDMRDSGKAWSEIRAALGPGYGASTLPNRYLRLKNNFVVINDEDKVKLLEAKYEIEQEFEESKWDQIAGRVKDKGGEEYTGEALRITYKRAMYDLGVVPSPGAIAPDFREHDD